MSEKISKSHLTSSSPTAASTAISNGDTSIKKIEILPSQKGLMDMKDLIEGSFDSAANSDHKELDDLIRGLATAKKDEIKNLISTLSAELHEKIVLKPIEINIGSGQFTTNLVKVYMSIEDIESNTAHSDHIKSRWLDTKNNEYYDFIVEYACSKLQSQENPTLDLPLHHIIIALTAAMTDRGHKTYGFDDQYMVLLLKTGNTKAFNEFFDTFIDNADPKPFKSPITSFWCPIVSTAIDTANTDALMRLRSVTPIVYNAAVSNTLPVNGKPHSQAAWNPAQTVASGNTWFAIKWFWAINKMDLSSIAYNSLVTWLDFTRQSQNYLFADALNTLLNDKTIEDDRFTSLLQNNIYKSEGLTNWICSQLRRCEELTTKHGLQQWQSTSNHKKSRIYWSAFNFFNHNKKQKIADFNKLYGEASKIMRAHIESSAKKEDISIDHYAAKCGYSMEYEFLYRTDANQQSIDYQSLKAIALSNKHFHLAVELDHHIDHINSDQLEELTLRDWCHWFFESPLDMARNLIALKQHQLIKLLSNQWKQIISKSDLDNDTTTQNPISSIHRPTTGNTTPHTPTRAKKLEKIDSPKTYTEYKKALDRSAK